MLKYVVGLTLAAAAALVAQEVAVPDKPVVSAITGYQVIGFSQERYPDWRFTITYRDNNEKVYTDVHVGLTTIQGPAGPVSNPEGADTFLKQWNTMNFSNISQTKRLLQHLVQHGKIPPSTVTGTPESDK